MKGSPEDFVKWQQEMAKAEARAEDELCPTPKLFKTNVRLFCIGFMIWQSIMLAFTLFGKGSPVTVEEAFIISVSFGFAIVAIKGR